MQEPLRQEQAIKKNPQVTKGVAQPGNFYERAIEWTHRADKIVNLILGYLLAIASVLGFMDVLSNGQVLNQVPFLFYVWLGIMGLGVDFQILLVIGRIPDLFRMPVAGWQKWLIFLFHALFLLFLCMMSIATSAIFTQHRDMPLITGVDPFTHLIASRASTIDDAMGILGLNTILFVYGRATLATLLLVLMAVDRTMERWRMSTQYVAQQGAITPTAAPALQVSDLDKVLQVVVTMNQQNLTQMQAMQQQTLSQVSQVTVSLLEETMIRLRANISLPGGTEVQHIGQGVPSVPDSEEDTEGTEGMASPVASKMGEQNGTARKSFQAAIETLLQQEPNLTDREIAHRIGCGVKTANKWRLYVQVPPP